ncbi:MAG: hypothetical protein QOC68_1050 [Solirubrobacteraceae bacterium]|nr:hypothetical protein [Solirubrobacteraceae bacterium]
MTDLSAAAQFIAAHARLIDRRRFGFIEGDGSADNVLRALAAYRNDDGGIGHLEPDLRTPASQPACVLYALDILHEVGARDRALATGALDWIRTVTREDGGVPFVLGTARGWPHAPWYQPQDDAPSSLLMTAAIAAATHRLGLDHPWLGPATAYCWERADAFAEGDPYTVRYGADFLDAVPDRARADALLDRLGARLPADGLLRVDAGTEGEVIRPLEVAPWPGHAARGLFGDAVIEQELDRLAAEQQDDGGWTFSWAEWNAAVAWEWRGAVTVAALRTLRAYGRLEVPARR